MIEMVRIPGDRMPVVIGKDGSVKKSIEKATKTTLEITDVVEIEGDDPLLFLKAKDMVKAIGRGFSPRLARRLLKEDCELHVISLRGETGKTRKRLVGRVIGNEGATKKRIEEETGAAISIRGKTLSLIGTPDQLSPAEEAVVELLSGKTHSYAYAAMRRDKARRR